MKAIISKNPLAKLSGDTEIIETIDITIAVDAIKQLSLTANLILENPQLHCDSAVAMAYIIDGIKRAVMPPNTP